MSEKIQVLWDMHYFVGGAVLNNHCALSEATSNPRRVNSCPGNMVALQSFKTSRITHPVTQYYIPKGLKLQCCCWNLILAMSEHFCLMNNTASPAFIRACENICQIYVRYFSFMYNNKKSQDNKIS
jgi:hypothetical protein